MPWVRFDDQYPIHRKVKPLSDSEYRFHTEAIFWCARNLTDGFVPTEDVSDVSSCRRPHKAIPRLVARGLLHEPGHQCTSPQCPPAPGGDGWMLHDYWDYQPSKAKVLVERKAKADRQARWLAKKKGAGGELSTGSGQRDASPDASQDASKDGAPPRPAPKEGGSGGSRSTTGRHRAGGAAGGEQNGHTSPKCHSCGNRSDSAYHRNTCQRTDQLAKGTP